LISLLKGLLGGGAPEPQTRVLMVCTGNICRSPTAEGVLRHKLAQAGLAGTIGVDSAGTQGYHTNEPPDVRAVRAAARRGYDIATLKARPILPSDFATFRWVLAMDQTHLDWLARKAPPARPPAALLMAFASRHPGVDEVPDPYYGGPEGFERVLDLIEDACDGVVARLRAGQPLA
jgi:protein-tyrosine phosphatase